MSAIFATDGTLVSTLNANDLLEETRIETEKQMARNTLTNTFSSIDPITSIYLRFLNEGVNKYNSFQKN